ncbi:MAG: carboxylating nicotinate-nucleotide diphosphorylase [Gemmatimonadota bacterium]
MDWPDVAQLIGMALAEDGWDRDVTSEATVPAAATGEALVVAKEPGVTAGLSVAEAVFLRVDPDLEVEIRCRDGQPLAAGDPLLAVSGRLRSILAAERTALNFLSRLCGIATLTRQFVEAVEGTGCQVTDTRKTTPGWRALEKCATAVGGAVNHRSGLHDMILIKENHIRAAGGISAALAGGAAAARAAEVEGTALEVEIEVTDLEELAEALQGGAGRILLDNMSLEMLREAAAMARAGSPPHPLLEASGGVRLDTVRSIAETGMDLISVGSITHSATVLDLSLQVQSVDGRDDDGAVDGGIDSGTDGGIDGGTIRGSD